MSPDLLSSFVAILALIFTLGSFWWIHARTGKLVTYPIIVFGGSVDRTQLQLRLPILIHNTGAKPVVIRGLQLRFRDCDGQVVTMPAQTFHSTLLAFDSFEDYVHAYVVPGRSVTTKYVRFLLPEMPKLLAGQPTDFVLQVLAGEKKNWYGLKTLSIHTGILGPEVTEMSNDPVHWRPDTVSHGFEYQKRIFSDPESEI